MQDQIGFQKVLRESQVYNQVIRWLTRQARYCIAIMHPARMKARVSVRQQWSVGCLEAALQSLTSHLSELQCLHPTYEAVVALRVLDALLVLDHPARGRNGLREADTHLRVHAAGVSTQVR